MGAHARGITKSMMLVTLVSKRMTTVLRLTTNFERSHVSDDVSEWRPQERIDRPRSGRNKARFDYCVSVSAKFQTCELCKNIPEESESIRNCNAMYRYHTDGPITFIMLEHYRTAYLLPMLVCSLRERVKSEGGTRAFSPQ